MKTKKLNVTPCQLPKPTSSKNTAAKYLLGSLAAAAVLPFAGSSAFADETNSVVAPTPPPAPPSRANFLVDLGISSHYLTPRGMDVVRQGLVLQPMILGLFNVY